MSLLAVSDLHAHNWSRFSSIMPGGVNSRFNDLLLILKEQIEPLIEEHQPEALLILGDLTHRRHYVHFSVYTPLMDWIANVADRLPVYVLVGNHDIEAHGFHSLGPLKHVHNVTVVDHPQWHLFSKYGYAYFVPYMADEDVRVACLAAETDRYRSDGVSTVFLHYALDGKILDHEFALPSSLRPSDVAKFDRVVMGHVHTPSIEDGGRVIYTGAPMHFDFGDAGDRYAWLIGEKVRQFKLTAPRFVTTSYPKIPVPSSDGFLRILNVPPMLLNDVKKAGLDAGWLDVVPMEKKIPLEIVKIMQASMPADEGTIRDYVAIKYPDVDDPARARIVDFALECLKEAEEL